MAELDLQYLGGVLRRICEGDDNAFAELFAATYEKQFMFSYVFLRDAQEAKEALQETYVRAYETIRTVQDVRLLVTWLRQINFRICYDMQQKRQIQNAETSEELFGIKAILALPYSESQAVFLRYNRGLSLREIGSIMGVSSNLISEYLDHGCARLLTRPVMTETEYEIKGIPVPGTEDGREILDNVYDMLGKAPCPVPIEVLSDYIVYRKDRYGFQKTLLMIVMILFVILPVFFITPDVRVQEETNGGTEGYYLLRVSAMVPVADIEAMIDGHPVGIRNLGKGEYKITPLRNGEMTVKVTLWNQQFYSRTIAVNIVDTERPELLDNQVSQGELLLRVCDDKSGIDYNLVYWINDIGEVQRPLRVDEESGEIVFPIPKDAVVIYVSDKSGNTLRLNVTFK